MTVFLIVAGNRVAAATLADEIGVPPNKWRFVREADDLYGYAGQILMVETDTVLRNPRYAEILDYAEARDMQVCRVSLDKMFGVQRP